MVDLDVVRGNAVGNHRGRRYVTGGCHPYVHMSHLPYAYNVTGVELLKMNGSETFSPIS